MIETALTRHLGIRIPVIQGGMMWLGRKELASAVSNAGGLGILTGLTPGSPELLREEIRGMRKLTNKPFGVNMTVLPTISPPPYAEYCKVIIEEGVKIVETAGSGGVAPMIKEFKKHGIKVIHKCTSIRHALSAQNKMMVDFVSIDGFECAGHPGEDDIGGVVLLARAAQELKIPFIASGGFANGQGLAGAIALGASGINCGTAFMITEEAPLHRNVKEEMLKANEMNTIHIFRTLKNTARVYRNKVAEEVVSIERRPGGCEFKDIQHLVSGARGRKVFEEGDVDAGIWTCGIAVGLLKEIVPTKVMMDKIESEAEEIMLSNAKMIKPPPRESKL